MPEKDSEGKAFHAEVHQRSELFYLKGSNELDWGMKNRLARIFRPEDGRTIMLAIDHGYFQGPTTGLERIDLSILPLVPYADVLMLTRGILRSVVPPSVTKPVVIRASGGPSILKELSDEQIAMDVEDSVRLGVCGMAIQVFIGGEFESRSVVNMTRLVDAGLRFGIPTMAVTAVGREMERNARYFRLAARICAELGAQYIKTYYVDQGFETVTASCPVPIVIAGGKKRPEKEALEMAWRAVDQGAAGVDMGRNIFQAGSPQAMMRAVQAVVHENERPEKAFELYRSLKAGAREGRTG
ncbi:MAG: 3-hydroxy-5-phosphonooxypentane-2,4-dione thiolase [Spirochaetota bacterium]